MIELHENVYSRLEPDVEKKFIQLLAIEQDNERVDHVENESVCTMIDQIRNEERQVTCATPNTET